MRTDKEAYISIYTAPRDNRLDVVLSGRVVNSCMPQTSTSTSRPAAAAAGDLDSTTVGVSALHLSHAPADSFTCQSQSQLTLAILDHQLDLISRSVSFQCLSVANSDNEFLLLRHRTPIHLACLILVVTVCLGYFVLSYCM